MNATKVVVRGVAHAATGGSYFHTVPPAVEPITAFDFVAWILLRFPLGLHLIS
jgi:hypothetical protein